MNSRLIIDSIGRNSYDRWRRRVLSERIYGLLEAGQSDQVRALVPQLKRWSGPPFTFYAARFRAPRRVNFDGDAYCRWEAELVSAARADWYGLGVDVHLWVGARKEYDPLTGTRKSGDPLIVGEYNGNNQDPHYTKFRNNMEAQEKVFGDLHKFLRALSKLVDFPTDAIYGPLEFIGRIRDF